MNISLDKREVAVDFFLDNGGSCGESSDTKEGDQLSPHVEALFSEKGDLVEIKT